MVQVLISHKQDLEEESAGWQASLSSLRALCQAAVGEGGGNSWLPVFHVLLDSTRKKLN